VATKRSIRKTRGAALVFLLPGLLYFGLVFVYPAARTIQLSLSRVTAENFVTGGWSFVGTKNFTSVWHLQATGQTITNTGIFLAGSIIPQVIIGGLLAVSLRSQSRMRRIGRSLVLLPWLMPSVAVAAIFLWIFNTRGGLANWILQSLGVVHDPVQWFTSSGTALFVIIAVNVWIGIPFNFLILQSGLQAVPADVHEAALIDGAGWWRELFSITVPIMKESVFAVVMLGLIGTLKVFDFVWIMTKGGPANATMLPGPLAYQEAFVQFDYGRGAAIVVVVVVVLIILSVAYVRITTPRTPRVRTQEAARTPALADATDAGPGVARDLVAANSPEEVGK
jgi:multiple sugar transport system permease protein